MNASLDARGSGLMLLLCALWGVQQIATKVAAEQAIQPLAQLAIRSSGAAVLLCAWVLLRQGRAGLAGLVRPDRTLMAGLVLGVMFTVEFVFIFEGVTRTTASQAVLLLYTTPFFTAAGAHMFIPGEKLTWVQAAGLVCAFAGVALTTGGLAGINLGDSLVLAGAIMWAATTITVRATSLAGASASRVLLYQLAVSGPLSLIAAAETGELSGLPAASALAWGSVAYQTIIVTFASYLVWFWLLKRYSPRPLSAFTLLTPLIGIVAGWAIVGEPISPWLIVSFVLIGAGLRLVNGSPPVEAATARDSALHPSCPPGTTPDRAR